MVARAVIVGIVAAGGLALGACSYTKADDAPVPSRSTTPVVPTARGSVVGTLPPISTVPPIAVPAAPDVTTGVGTVAPPSTPAASAATTAASAAPKPATTRAPSRTGGSASVQAGSFSTHDAAAQAVSVLAGKGFGGFAVSGSGPFRVVRGGLSGADAQALVQSLAAAGVSAFVRS